MTDNDSTNEPDGITLDATSFKVSATEKRSIGEYENYQPHATIEGEIDAPGDVDREVLRDELTAYHAMLRGVVRKAADDRVAYDGADRTQPRE